jgi:hypothetical protein
MMIASRRHLAYLLRLWQESDVGKITWRASLEDPHTGHRQGFVNIESMIDFLHQLMQASPSEEQGDTDKEL